MPPIALGTLLVLLFAYLACALGVRLQHLARLEFVNPGERLLVAAGLGLGALQAVSFLLFALGIGRPPAFHLVLGLLSIALIPDGIRVSVLVRAWARTLRPIEIRQWALYAIFGILLGALYLRALCPLTSHDDLSYHLAASVRFLDAGGFRYMPTLTYTNWPTAVELLFATGLAIHREAPVAVVQFLFGLITLGGVYA